MANLNKKSKVKNLDGGILMPQLANKWRIQFTGDHTPLSSTEMYIFGMQMVACSVDYKLKTLSLIIEQDSETTHLHDMVKKLTIYAGNDNMTDKISFELDMLDGGGDAKKSFVFNSCSLIAHSFDLSYGETETAKHKVKLSYKTTNEV